MSSLPGKEHRVGRTMIRLPPEHGLDVHLQHWLRLDLAIGDLSRLLGEHHPGFAAIDIGANVGDTASAICSHADVPVLCIEGNPTFLPYLQENARRIGSHVVIEPSFIGAPSEARKLRIEQMPGGDREARRG